MSLLLRFASKVVLKSMSKTSTYLLSRQRELELEITELQAELTRVKIAQVAISRLEPSERNASDVRRVDGSGFKPPKTNSIKDMVLEILEDAPSGLKALDILDFINAGYSANLKRTSLSPQLSRLKEEGKIHNSGLIWHRVSPVPKGDTDHHYPHE